MIDYGIRLLNPNIFFVATAAICALVGVVTGKLVDDGWDALGVAFVGMATVLGLSEAAAAGAVICGAYFGDKMTPLSEATSSCRIWSATSPCLSTSATCSGPPGQL